MIVSALNNTVEVTGGGPACFAAGTRIATVHGNIAVEHLQIGDAVKIFGGGSAPVKWIGMRHYSAPFLMIGKFCRYISSGMRWGGMCRRAIYLSRRTMRFAWTGCWYTPGGWSTGFPSAKWRGWRRSTIITLNWNGMR